MMMEDYDEYDDYELEDVGPGGVSPPYDNSPFVSDISAKEVFEACMEPTVLSAFDQLIWVMFACLIFRICTQLVKIPRFMCHLISFACGLTSLFSIVGPNAIYTSILAIGTYWCMVSCAKRSYGRHTYKIIVGSLLSYLVGREYYTILPESWEQVRGIQMILVMKTLSLCYELWNESRKELPPFVDYLGYLFCPGTIIFGPWISFTAYTNVFEGRRWGLGWVIKVFATAAVSVVCLGFSSCWVYYFFGGLNLSWIIAVRDAMSVRFSHYFVCFVSEVTSTLSGFYSEEGVTIEVTNPWKIELPRSLVEVVIHWNISMHKWLKHHIFRPAKVYGPFKSVLLTFLASSMLHGMNFNLTIILLSLGCYTYVEYNLREKMASIFDACIRSRSCPPKCEHFHKSTHPMVIATNIIFGIWSFFHLAYLGIMMDKSHLEESGPIEGVFDFFSKNLKRWDDLGYASHWAVLFVFIANLVI